LHKLCEIAACAAVSNIFDLNAVTFGYHNHQGVSKLQCVIFIARNWNLCLTVANGGQFREVAFTKQQLDLRHSFPNNLSQFVSFHLYPHHFKRSQPH